MHRVEFQAVTTSIKLFIDDPSLLTQMSDLGLVLISCDQIVLYLVLVLNLILDPVLH